MSLNKRRFTATFYDGGGNRDLDFARKLITVRSANDPVKRRGECIGGIGLANGKHDRLGP